MSETNRFILGLLAIIIGLGACQRKSTTPIRGTPTQPTVVLEPQEADSPQATTSIFTNTATSTATATTSMQQITPDASATQTPVAVSQITSTPAPTLTPTFPEWMAATDANILFLYKNGTITIFNANSGERYDINTAVTDSGPRWVWHEDRYLLSLTNSKPTSRMLDTVTGEFIRIENDAQQGLSPNGRYLARIEEDSPAIVSIINLDTNAETELVNPYRNLQTRDEDFNEYAHPIWSPDGTFLSVVYQKRYYSDNYDLNLVIYVPSGEIFRQYRNLSVSWPNYWAPVLPHRILYTERSQACFLEIVKNERSCPEAIANWLSDRDVVFLNHAWSLDGARISFIYYDNSGTSDSGACYYDMDNETIACPISMTDLQLGELMFVRRQFLSPNGNYIVVFFDDFGYSEDVFGSVGVIVADIENQNVYFIDGEYSWPIHNPWRPPTPEQIDE